ncbi:MAG: hypothetical protein QME83_12210 [Thermodesulfobacteriota bacterium]|nr:hypothetical protein [Thermodesulfobacteriota bacterium]
MPPCLRRSACPPHEASAGGASRRQAQIFLRWPACPSGFGIPMDFYHGKRDAYSTLV